MAGMIPFIVNLFNYIKDYSSNQKIQNLEEQGIVNVNGFYYSARKVEKKPEELFLKVGASIYILSRIVKKDENV